MITLTINDKIIAINKGTTILDAAKKAGINIPTLCHMDLEPFSNDHTIGSCRVCVVEVEGQSNLAPACCTEVKEGMVVRTNTLRSIIARRAMVSLLLSNHPKDCLTCEKNLECELQQLAMSMGLHHLMFPGEMAHHAVDLANEAIVRDPNKCIMCRRCETACNKIQTVGILSGVKRGFNAYVAPTLEKPLSQTKCTFCGQCVSVCPTGALTEMNIKSSIWMALADSSKTVVVQTAPAVRVAIGEEFGMSPGSIVTGKLVSALRMLGFKRVFDTDFAADLTIMEEATELVDRLKTGENLPILTSCCPGWVKFLEHQFPDLLNIPSTAKSPQQMLGAITKSYYAQKTGIRPEDIIMVSVMPCLSKKYEASRPEFSKNGVRDVDYVLSTRELASMISEIGIDFTGLDDSEFDSPLGESSGAAVIFGSSGGVIEAALRTCADFLTGENIRNIDFREVRGLEATKEAVISIGGKELRVACTSGLGNTRKLLEKIRHKEEFYHAIEVMACPGGCLNGGGQPFSHYREDILEKRKEAIYRTDREMPVRKSHQNPSIQKLYRDFLGKPGSTKAHELLHTRYIKRENR